ncbi:unnamed protein product [Psylliodes chrysocephalus]|uniref:Transforming acidic coiled-coil-containing protein C-terminal domain-containing protein n=1 Tax=Psylliodes chrysocephalus TaxID=3402493 RepID=A0A9P0G626_9CUCU|nr:unnamed protein product [Psylliodes chrysocephala]
MNEPSDINMNGTMDTNSEGVAALSGKLPDLDLEIQQKIHAPKTYLDTAGNIIYDSPGDTFYNTVDIKTDDVKKSINSKSLDLINFDQSSIRFSVGGSDSESYCNSPLLNETFNQITGVVLPVNKHLKVKTADLLSVSGIGGRYSTSSETQSINNDSLNDSKVNFEDANDYYTTEEIVIDERSSSCSPILQLDHIEDANIPQPENTNDIIFENHPLNTTDLIENIQEKVIAEKHNLNKTHCTGSVNETIIFEDCNLNISDLSAKVHNDITVGNHNLNTTFNNTREYSLIDNDIEIKGESEKTEANHIDGGHIDAVTSIEVCDVEEVDLTRECIEFEQLSPASPRSPITEDPGKEESLSDNVNIQENTQDLVCTLSPKDYVKEEPASDNFNIQENTEDLVSTLSPKDIKEESTSDNFNIQANTEDIGSILCPKDSLKETSVSDNFNIQENTEILGSILCPKDSVKEPSVNENLNIQENTLCPKDSVNENLNIQENSEDLASTLCPKDSIKEKSVSENLNIQEHTLCPKDSVNENLNTQENTEDLTSTLCPKDSIKEKSVSKNLNIQENTLCPKDSLGENLNIQENTENLASTLYTKDPNCNFKMTDLSETLNQQQAEISDLKLKLNASQQHNASLELQIRQNEEIVIKTQAEALRTEQNYQQEVKQLKEKLNENSKTIEKDRIRELEDQLKDCRAREAKLLAEISQRTKDDVNLQRIMEQYEVNLKSRIVECKKFEEENRTIKTHLTNLELAFSDVHSKYEKTKAALQGVKANEEALLSDLDVAQATNVQHEERYESLKAHARTQIEKSNKEIHSMKELHEMEMSKLKAYARRLEIKLSSLEVSLQQKTEECEQLSALCDEVTGKQV